MSGKSRCNFLAADGTVAPPSFYDGLGVPDDWAFPMTGRPDGLGADEWAFLSTAMAFTSNAMEFPSNGGSDEWKGRCNLHLTHFTDGWAFPFNGRSENRNAH